MAKLQNYNGRFCESECENAFLSFLGDEGWQYLPGGSIPRSSQSEVLYIDDLEQYLSRKKPDLTAEEVRQIMDTVRLVGAESDFATLHKVYGWMVDGIQFVPQSSQPRMIPLIDFEKPENNIFRAVNQFTVEYTNNGQNETRRPDIILFVNGLPLCVMELKNPADANATIYDAWEQINIRYWRDIPHLLHYCPLACISDSVKTRLGTVRTPYEHFYAWRRVNDSDEISTLPFAEMETMIRGAYSPSRFLEIFRDYIYFQDSIYDSEEKEIVCRYPQFFAARLLKQSIVKPVSTKSGKGGTYFGATGCGKTYTMAFLARQLALRCTDVPAIGSPTIVMIVDRDELQKQGAKLFTKSEEFLQLGEVRVVPSRKVLREELGARESDGFYICTIQKFCDREDDKIGLINDRANIICFSDEAHRTQIEHAKKIQFSKDTDENMKAMVSKPYAKVLREAFPQATFVGFTGTPIAETYQTFGEEIDRYTMDQAVADGLTVSIKYHPRIAKVLLDQQKVKEIEDYYKKCADDGATREDIEASKKAMSSMEVILGEHSRLERLAVDIHDHYVSSCANDPDRIQKAMIPRMGKRVDVVVLYRNIVFLLEFKCGDTEYRASTYDQVYDYALDLRNFQKESHNKLLVPIMVSTRAPEVENVIVERDRIIEPLSCNTRNIAKVIETVCAQYTKPAFDYIAWENSEYLPTPTIVEAAQALYRVHNVHDITRSDAGAENLTVTTDDINRIIEYSKANHRKSICFVTGVPGAGKTLVGLNLAIQRSDAQRGEHAVFLSGNFPLVTVLQEALARDKVEQEKQRGNRVSKADALRSTSAFIQIIHKYRDSFVGNNHIPPERIAIFDEAQRAWTHDMIAKFMLTKKGVAELQYSEPEFLISTMDRHQDWAVIICLVGGGQEINTGEAGLPEWFDSLRRAFPAWDVYITPQLNDAEYRREREWDDMIADLHIFERGKPHLTTSVRSFRTPDMAAFVKAVLDVDIDAAKDLYVRITDKYPVKLTSDLETAKRWVREQCQGTTRYGMLASSGALRLKPEGIFVKNEVSVANWFLNGKDDVRSSYYLEDVVSEFDIQGLELDFSIVAWDADFRFDGTEWTYYNFVGNRWQNVASDERKLYLKNAYRVLLTRARQGMVIFIPRGSDIDQTRNREWYDGTYNYLQTIGVEEI